MWFKTKKQAPATATASNATDAVAFGTDVFRTASHIHLEKES